MAEAEASPGIVAAAYWAGTDNPEEVPTETEDSGDNLCRRCAGTGRVDGAECPECQGTGIVNTPVGGGG